MKHERDSMLRDSFFLSIFSVALQCLGLLFNVFLTRMLGASSVGVLTLIGSFYGLAAVFSSGSGFLAASRFVSEEIACQGNPRRVFRNILRFTLPISLSAAALIMLLTGRICSKYAEFASEATAIRLLALSLPIAALSSALRGRCYAYHRVYIPAIADCIEFIMRSGVISFCTVFFIRQNYLSILSSYSLAALAGQGSVLIFYLAIRMPKQEACTDCQHSFWNCLKLTLPMIGNACLVSVLSTANDALVPLTLRQYGNSTQSALAQFGEFEAIIIPTLFFPSVVQCCMSGLLVPELSRYRAANNTEKARQLTERVLKQTISYSLIIVIYLVQFGGEIGALLGGDDFTGIILRKMAPVIPFIYLEIILEGVLRGLGKQNFSSLNYLAEYTVRISVLLICVPLFGFYGIVASYLACNLSGNAVRLFFVLRATGLKPNWKTILVRPLFASTFSWQITNLIAYPVSHLQIPKFVYMGLYGMICTAIYVFLLRLLEQIHTRNNPSTTAVRSSTIIQPES